MLLDTLNLENPSYAFSLSYLTLNLENPSITSYITT